MFKRLVFLALSLLILNAKAYAATVAVDDLYARATFPMAATAAVYFTVTNTSATPVTLVGVSTTPDIAGDAQLHTTDMQDGMMKMRHMKEGVTIQPGAKLTLAPGGYHVMLLGLKQGLSPGMSVPLTLHFGDDSSISLNAPVKKLEEQTHQHHNH